jgi:UDP-N-acetyl-D-galactosamine dehydrogenase
MANHVSDRVIKLMLGKNIPVLGSRILVLGLSFKENCPDLRNTKIADLVACLKAYNVHVDVYDPWIDLEEAQHEYGIECLADMPTPRQYAAVILAVGHRQFIAMGESGIKALGHSDAVIFDVKSILPIDASDGRL